jgi:hypothetical protein
VTSNSISVNPGCDGPYPRLCRATRMCCPPIERLHANRDPRPTP